MGQGKRDNSVLTNLRELERLERARSADEEARVVAAAEAKERAAAEEKARAEEAEVQARRLAEAEVRVGLDEERAARDAEAEQRVASLRAELAAVQADRERMHARIATVADDAWSREASRGQSWGWKAAFASAGAVAAGLALILAVQEPVVESRIVEVPVERTVVVEAPAPTPEAAVRDQEVPAEIVAAAPAARTDARVGRPRQDHDGMRPRMVTMEPDPFGDLNCPDDDPTCGI